MRRRASLPARRSNQAAVPGCGPASKFGSNPAGRPIGAIPAIRACRPRSISPAPERFADGAGGDSIGYTGDIVFPLRIVAQDAAKPSSLHVKLGYAICANLCVPAEADLDLMLSGASGSEESALVAAEARVPRHVPLGAGTGLAIRSVHRESGGAHEHVVVEVAAPEGAPVQLFAEGPTPNWALPLPEPSGGASGTRRFTFDLDGLPPGAHAEGAALTLTAVSPKDAIEVGAHLD
jgi:DsbC/DsbD-like thiol-disulfide interchange protein